MSIGFDGHFLNKVDKGFVFFHPGLRLDTEGAARPFELFFCCSEVVLKSWWVFKSRKIDPFLF